MNKFFRVAFALSGTRTPVPDAADASGFVSYIEGYGADYQRPKTDPLSKNIERDKMNQVFFDMTTAIGELQSQGIPDFITTALNGGSPFPYAAKALVRYSGALYMSLAAANTALPTDTTKWVRFDDIRLTTAMFSTFDQAIAAAVAAGGDTLYVNSAVAIAASVTVPATIGIIVLRDGSFTVAAGQTLTIMGSFEAGEFQCLFGAGTVYFHSNSRSKTPRIWYGTPGGIFDTRRALVQNAGEPGGPVHAFEDNCTLNFTYPLAANFNAYAAYDAQTTATGAGDYDHMVAFQARQTYNGSGSIWSRWDSFNCLKTHSGTGTVALARGFHMENPLGSGTITTLCGYHCEALTRGATNIGFYSATPFNAVQTAAGQTAQWNLCGNGQGFTFGLILQSDASSNARIRQTANLPLYIGTNNVDHTIVTADGRWKFGSLTDIVGSTNKIEAQGTNGVVMKITSGLNPCYLNWSAAAAGDNVFQAFYTEASITQRGSIDYNRAGGAVRYNTTSDKTLKTRLGPAPVEKSIAILDGTVLEEYFWNDDPSKKPQIGPFAQDLQKVFKGAVSEGGEYEVEIAEVTEQRLISGTVEGGDAVFETVVISPARKETRYRPWAVDKTAFTFHLVAAYQRQRDEIRELRDLVSSLAKRLDDLGG